jgi:hypothetical protein
VHFLPESDKNDSVLAVGLADADFDHEGHTEILVGTYGCKLLVYKEITVRSSFQIYLVALVLRFSDASLKSGTSYSKSTTISRKRQLRR